MIVKAISFRLRGWTINADGMRFFVFLISVLFVSSLRAEDGSRLWLRMEQNAKAAEVRVERGTKRTPTIDIAARELENYWKGGCRLSLRVSPDGAARDGFTLRRSGDVVEMSSASDRGVLYAAYTLLRMQQVGDSLREGQVVAETPAYDLRILNHWDNPNGTVERGYAGRSIWKWDELPAKVSPRYEAYARANASVGINGAVLNNVNAKPGMLSSDMLRKVAAIADVLRPYGIRTFLSVNFASPKALGGLSTADPLDADVQKWWADKVAEIYKLVPDFGGFLVKANSEGEPGPQDYGRSHVDGANMLADVLAPHGGLVMWRAFVYQASSPDRACQAYEEFMPLDGQFKDNVIIQVKNGPVDFQPREPFSPLFGAMRHTQVMPEFQVTQEYLGQSIHTVFLATMWKDVLSAETYQDGGLTVGEATLRRTTPKSVTAMAGVSNIGDSENWTGSDMAQANWYAFGRLCWDPEVSAARLADEFLKQTFSADERFVGPMRQVLLRSWEAAVHYMMPYGLHHIFAGNHHYGPEPWYHPGGNIRLDWLPEYYHRADSVGLGFDRTKKGSNGVAQYHEPLATLLGDLRTCPEEYLLWFHHVPWTYVMRNGLTLWDNLCYTYNRGVDEARHFAAVWNEMRPYVDGERFARQKARFDRQAKDAVWWRDACLLYFRQFSGMPLPADCPAPQHRLDDLMKYHLNIDNYTAADMEKLP